MGQNQHKSISKKVLNHLFRRKSYYSGGDSSKEASISLPLRAISSGIIVFSVAFLASCLTASIVTPVQNSNADTISATIDTSGYYVNVTSHDVDLNLVATPDGSAVVAKDTVTTETNSPTGFKLYISSNSNVASANRLTHSAGFGYIPTVTGTISSPTTLATNTWGYALTSMTQNGGSTSNPSAGSVTTSSYFVGMPLLNNENLIQETSSATPTGSPATVDVYFGVKANTAIPSGVYTSTVVYTVLAEGYPAHEGEVSVSPETSTMAGGTTLTIATGLYTNVNDIGTVTVTVGGQTCSNVTRIANSSSGSINLTCTLPARTSAGWQEVVVSIPKFGKTYTLTQGVRYIPETLAQLSALDLSERYLQYMTDDICDEMTEATASNYASVQLQLTDSRDGNSYITRKLKDGNCWMTENLRLTFQNGYAVHSTTGALTELTSDNSDFTTISSWDGGGHTTETAENHTVWYSNGANPENLANSYTYGTEKCSLDDTEQYKGGLYNWYVATAGSGTYSLSGTITVEDSICPYGWRLPLGTQSDKSFYSLANGLAGSDLLVAPYSFSRASLYHGVQGRVSSPTSGYWWSATNSSSVTSVYSATDGHNFYSQASDSKGYGFSIRCVSK